MVFYFTQYMCTCFFPIVMELRLVALRAAGAPLKLNILSKQLQTKATETVRILALKALFNLIWSKFQIYH